MLLLCHISRQENNWRPYWPLFSLRPRLCIMMAGTSGSTGLMWQVFDEWDPGLAWCNHDWQILGGSDDDTLRWRAIIGSDATRNLSQIFPQIGQPERSSELRFLHDGADRSLILSWPYLTGRSVDNNRWVLPGPFEMVLQIRGINSLMMGPRSILGNIADAIAMSCWTGSLIMHLLILIAPLQK